MALIAIESTYCQRLAAPKYNPANKRMFCLEHWQSVAETIRTFGPLKALEEFELWCSSVSSNIAPKKADQDKVDAMICGLIGMHWLVARREQSVMLGDLESGYMITPAVNGVHERLVAAARKRNVSIR